MCILVALYINFLLFQLNIKISLDKKFLIIRKMIYCSNKIEIFCLFFISMLRMLTLIKNHYLLYNFIIYLKSIDLNKLIKR